MEAWKKTTQMMGSRMTNRKQNTKEVLICCPLVSLLTPKRGRKNF
jgi:hypothetical protein